MLLHGSSAKACLMEVFEDTDKFPQHDMPRQKQ